MPRVRRVAPLIACVLMFEAGARGAEATAPSSGGLPYDLSKVRGIDALPRDERLRALLSTNGFVVVPREHRQIFGAYAALGRSGPYVPPFVTVDSAVRTYQVILAEGFRLLETAQAPRLAAISARLRADLGALSFDAPPWRDAKERLEAWAAVGRRLQDREAAFGTLSGGARSLAAREWESIGRGTPAESAIFGRGETFQYGHLQATGFYASKPVLAAYARAVKWYGLTSFRVRAAEELPRTLLLAAVIHGDRDLRTMIERFAAPFDALLGAPDDLTVTEAADVYGALAGASTKLDARTLSSLLPEFGKRMAALRMPRANDQAVPLLDPDERAARTQSVRLLPPRHTWEAEMATSLNAVPLPTLCVPLAMGDDHSAALLRRENERLSVEQIEKFRTIGATAFAGSGATLYKECLDTLCGVFAPVPAGAPPFARTSAWKSACTFAVLGEWTAIRHQFELHAKETAVALGSDHAVRPAGLVAPYPHVFRNLAALGRKTSALLEGFGAFAVTRPHEVRDAGSGIRPSSQTVRDSLAAFVVLMEQLAAMAEKQLRGEVLSGEERGRLERYADTLAYLHFYGDADVPPGDDMPQALLHATYTDEDGVPLYEHYAAIGRAFEIYVIREAPAEKVYLELERRELEIPAGLQLYRGGVLSFFETTKDLGTPRLTDERWKDVLNGGAAGVLSAALPAWASEFVHPVRWEKTARLETGILPGGDDERRAIAKDFGATLKKSALEGCLKGGEDCGDLLEIYLAHAGPDDAERLLQLAAEVAAPEHVTRITGRFCEVTTPEARTRLLATAATGHPNLRLLAYHAASFDAPMAELRTMFGDSEEGRFALASALGKTPQEPPEMPADKERTLIALATEDPSFLVRAAAMRSLTAAPAARAVPVMRRGLSDPSPAVRACAAASLTDLEVPGSFADALRVLWYLADRAVRERVEDEGVRLRDARQRLVCDEDIPAVADDKKEYLSAMLLRSQERARVPAARLAGLYAAHIADGKKFNGSEGIELQEGDQALYEDLALGFVLDASCDPERRAEALEALWSGRPVLAATGYRLEALLGDETVFPWEPALHVGDIAAAIVLSSLEGARWRPLNTPAERRDVRARAKAALVVAPYGNLQKTNEHSGNPLAEEKRPSSARDTPPPGDPDRPWGIAPRRIDAALGARFAEVCAGAKSYEAGVAVLQYTGGDELAGDRLPLPQGASVCAYGWEWPGTRAEEGINAGSARSDGEETEHADLLTAGGEGALFLAPVFRGAVTVQCVCAFHFIGECSPAFLVRVGEDDGGCGASFGVRAVHVRDDVVDRAAPSALSDNVPELPAALRQGKLVKLHVELRWPEGADKGSLHVFFDGKEVSVLEGIDDPCGRVGFSWKNCYFSLGNLKIEGKLDRAWAVEELCRRVFSIDPDRLGADELKGRVYGALLESLQEE